MMQKIEGTRENLEMLRDLIGRAIETGHVEATLLQPEGGEPMRLEITNTTPVAARLIGVGHYEVVKDDAVVGCCDEVSAKLALASEPGLSLHKVQAVHCQNCHGVLA